MLKTIKLINEESRLESQIESEFETNDWIDDEKNEFFLDGSDDEGLSNLVENSIKSAAHILPLSIQDTLKNSHDDAETDIYIDTVTMARSIVKKLRTSNMSILLRLQKFKKPIVDCPTR